jgi:hypothetical protein
VAGPIVSHHGGRQLDTVPATLDRLPVLAEALGDAVPLLLDGGCAARHGRRQGGGAGRAGGGDRAAGAVGPGGGGTGVCRVFRRHAPALL